MIVVMLGYGSRWVGEWSLKTLNAGVDFSCDNTFEIGRGTSAKVVMTPASTSDTLDVVRGSPLSAYEEIRVNGTVQ